MVGCWEHVPVEDLLGRIAPAVLSQWYLAQNLQDAHGKDTPS